MAWLGCLGCWPKVSRPMHVLYRSTCMAGLPAALAHRRMTGSPETAGPDTTVMRALHMMHDGHYRWRHDCRSYASIATVASGNAVDWDVASLEIAVSVGLWSRHLPVVERTKTAYKVLGLVDVLQLTCATGHHHCAAVVSFGAWVDGLRYHTTVAGLCGPCQASGIRLQSQRVCRRFFMFLL